jgi:hypothetical protein
MWVMGAHGSYCVLIPVRTLDTITIDHPVPLASAAIW